MNEEEYMGYFQGDPIADNKHKAALQFALETRKLEIELYWKRATYFWTFIAVTFAGYGLAQRIDGEDKEFISFFLCCLGFVLASGWVFVNRGSKQWQENWEHHVDHLENDVMGPLYKITMPRSKPEGLWEWVDFVFVGPSKHSVSKINQLISMYIAFLWFVLMARAPITWDLRNWTVAELAVFLITILCVIAIIFMARTNLGPHTHKPHLRDSYIEDDEGY